MILIKENTAGPTNSPIKEWKVGFQCPFGFTFSLEAAQKACRENDFNENLCIIPVAVVITTDDHYEVVVR